MKLGRLRSADFSISFDKCSNTYRPLIELSLIAVVFVALTIPFTRKATTATMRMQATPSVTIVSTSVNPTGPPFRPPFRICWMLLMKRLKVST